MKSKSVFVLVMLVLIVAAPTAFAKERSAGASAGFWARILFSWMPVAASTQTAWPSRMAATSTPTA